MDYFKMGYLNILGVVKAMVKSLLLSIPVMILWSIIAVLAIVGVFTNSLVLTLSVCLLGFLASFILAPIIGNVTLVLLRKYVVEGSRIDLRDAFKEARDRIKGRYLHYYFASFGIALAVAVIIFLCVISVVGMIVVPIIIQVSLAIVMIIAYQGDATVSCILQKYGKDLALISLGVFLVTSIGALIPVLGTILLFPASLAISLFIADNFS